MKQLALMFVLTGSAYAQHQVGTVFCTSNPNDSGRVAGIECWKDGGILQLKITGANPYVYAQLYGSLHQQPSVPFGGGRLCLGFNSLVRLGPPKITGYNGGAFYHVTSQELLGVGELFWNRTVNFQWVYRDLYNQNYFNTSNALTWNPLI